MASTNQFKFQTTNPYQPTQIFGERGNGHVHGPVNIDNCIVRLNISGTHYEVFRSTLINKPDIYQKLIHDALWIEESKEWFLERDPSMFSFVLAYLHHGELHLPTHLCGPLIEKELAMWGISYSKDIQPCCMGSLTETKSKRENLHKFEEFFLRKKEKLDNFIENPNWQAFRKRMWKVIDKPTSSLLAKLYFTLQTLAVLFAIFIYVAGTDSYFRHVVTDEEWHKIHGSKENAQNDSFTSYTTPKRWLQLSNYPCMALFTLNIVLRLVFCPSLRLLCLNFYTIIEIIALLPFYCHEIYISFSKNKGFSHADDVIETDYISLLKIFLVLRIFQLLRHSKGLRVLLYTIKAAAIDVFIMIIFIMFSVLTFGSLIYFVEKHEDFPDIPTGMWWSIVTMTSVGYGDIYPKTFLGRIIGSVCAVMGLLMLAFTFPGIVNHYILYYSHANALSENRKRKKSVKNELEHVYFNHVAP